MKICDISKNVLKGIRDKYRDMNLIFRKECVIVSWQYENRQLSKSFHDYQYGNIETAGRYARAYRDEVYFPSSRNNTGYKNIVLVVNKDKSLRIVGGIKYNNTFYSKSLTIHNAGEYYKKLKSIINYISELIGIRFIGDIDVSHGMKFINNNKDLFKYTVYLVRYTDGSAAILNLLFVSEVSEYSDKDIKSVSELGIATNGRYGLQHSF